MHHLWHPSYVSREPIVLEAFATLGDAFTLSRGTDELVRAALARFGITAAPRRWTFVATRTHYFNEYRGEPDCAWADAWSLAWRLRAELDEAPPLPAPPRRGYFDLEEADATFRFSDSPEDWPAWPCLVLADAPDEETLIDARKLVEARFPDAELTFGEAYRQVPQLRVLLGDRPRAFYEAGAAEAEALLSVLTDVGASVRFDDTLRLLRL